MTDNRGRRVGLTRETILARAVELADRGGVDTVTMRRLAAQLGVEAMTLYHYIPNKAALHDGMIEHVVTLIETPFDEMPWQEALHTYATSLFAALREHPGVAALMATRPALTARTMSVLESALAALQTAGIPAATGLLMVQALTAVTVGHARVDGETSGHVDGEKPPPADPGAHPLLCEALAGGRPGDDMFDDVITTIIAGFAVRRGEPSLRGAPAEERPQ